MLARLWEHDADISAGQRDDVRSAICAAACATPPRAASPPGRRGRDKKASWPPAMPLAARARAEMQPSTPPCHNTRAAITGR